MAEQYFDLHAEGFEIKKKQRYSVNQSGQVKWVKSQTINTYIMDDMHLFSKWLSFETRAVAAGKAVYGCSKAVVVQSQGIKVVCSLIPPLIVEKCLRSHGRVVLAVTCNIFTMNELDAVDLPPLFEYATGQRK
eukprot:424818-Pleurochrysis_carterae.AAC.1